MASSVQKGVTFSLAIALSASPKTAIKPQQREQIFEYIKSQLPLFKKHVHTVEEINFFDILSITKDAKSVIKLEISVSDSKDLENFFQFAKYSQQQDKKNDLSYIFTTFFQNQEMQLKCGFSSSTKINITVGISETERKKLAADLEKRLAKRDKILEESKMKDNSVRNKDNSTNSTSKSPGRHSTDRDVDLSNGSRIKKTFLIDVPDKEVTSVRLHSDSIKELNCEMFRSRQNIYSVDIELPVEYDPYADYWYEIKFKDAFIFISYTKEEISKRFTVGDKTVHRDLVWGLDSVYSHLQDIIYSISERYSDSDLCMQIEDICAHCSYYDENKIIKYLLDNGVLYSSKYLVRFALIVGNLCKKFFSAVYKQLDRTIAHEMLDALSQRKLADFPASCNNYMPDLCKHLCKIGYGDAFCILLFLSRMSSFLPKEQLLLALQGCLSSHEKFVTDSPTCEKLAEDSCMSFYIEYLRTGSPAAKDIVDFLFRHLPLEMSLQSYGQIARHSGYKEDKSKEREEDALTAVNASIKSQVLAFANKALREKKVMSLLKIATLLGKFKLNADTSIRTTFEEGVMSCFSWYSLKETDVKQEVEDFIEHSGCFLDLEGQLSLLKSISESGNQPIRRLSIELNEDKFLLDAYDHLEIDVYKSWLQNEIKTFQTRNKDEILFTFRTLCQILKLPIVVKRTEVRKELELVTMNSLKRYTLKEMLQHIEKIEYLCDKEPTVSFLYKEQVQELLKKKGKTPTEVLKLFCWNNSLRVNTVTTCDIVCTIIELFFEKSAKDKLFDAFIYQIPHVAFWELIANANGSRIHDVKNNATYKQVMSCIKRVTILLRNSEIDISFMSKINVKDEKTKRILRLGGMQQKDIDAMQINFNKVVQKATRDVKGVIAVLEEVQGRRSDPTIPELSVILTKTKLMKAELERGNISVKESSSVRWLWGDLGELPEICNELEPVVKSNVFWNVAEKVVLESFGTILKTETTPSVGLTSVRYLFDDEIGDDYVHEIENTEQIVWFLKTLKEKGLKFFEQKWKNLESDITLPMQSVQAMFENANVPDEIKTAEQYLQRNIKHTVKETLCRIWKKNEVLEKAKAMASVLAAFGYDISKDTEVNSALKSFQELIQQTISEYTLQDVQIALQTIFSLADKLTDETVDIMAEIGKSSLLLEFLKEIAIEDVRNLIDAVEDISESHVQESTVSALIETKRFLLPLLTPANIHEKGSQWIFQTLQKQTTALGKNASSIPGKINDCSLNLHNLKSLYNNVANRGQQTKEVIKSIITKGKFAFMLCPELDRVMFEVTYKENKNRFTKQEATVLDIRSRALLLLNTERQCAESSFNQEEFRIFIESVDLCLEIRNILNELYTSGHIRYKSFKLCLQSDELQQTKDRLKRESDEWMIHMHEARNKYYLMNFIQGCQIRVISDFLENGSGKDVTEAILRYIHPSLTVKALSETYRKEVYLFNESFVLEELGRSLHEMYENHKLFFRAMKCEDFTTKITDCVHKGRVLVAQLDEKSEFVVRTVLTLYRNTTHQFPEPNQLLFCTRDTTWSEIDLLLQRCKGSYYFYGSLPLYCLANVELLQNEVQFRLVEELQNLTDISDFRLAIVCRGSKNHPFVDQLYDCVVTIQTVSDQALESLLHTHHPNVFAYTSEVAGLGKTTNICKKSLSAGRSTVTLHISGQVRKSTLIANLNELKIQGFHTLHLDIGVVDEPVELDTVLFELVVLKYIVSGVLAFYMPTDYVCFEIGNTINNALRNSMTTVTSFKREHLLWNEFSNFVCSQEINSPVQVVCQYLNALEEGLLDKKELHFSDKSNLKPLSAVECRLLLKKHMDVASDISFSVAHIFLNVLSDQLKKLSFSAFFKVSRISEMIGASTVPTVRSNLVKSMVNVSMEFAARSVNACRSTQSSTLGTDFTSDFSSADNLVDKIIHRVDGMIRWEESNHLIYVFHNQNIHTLSPMYRDKDKVPEHIRKLFESQMKRSLPNFSTMEQVQLQNMLQRVARTNPTALAEKQLNELSKDYALTPDNLLKMVLIMMRIQSKVPVLIMGETGCGKTSLIRYLACICEVPFKVLNVHAGVYTAEIVSIVMQENAKCLENLRKQRWLFLDEINTSENIGLICDVICHRRCIGSILSPNLVIMGACNPYKLRTVEAIHTAGLTGKVKSDELSKLVYRVLPLPEMMVDYVWDFGSLSEKDELKYIQRMVEGVFADGTKEHALLSDLLSISQIFVREIELSTCVVSLRDVQRCKTLVPWFIKIIKEKNVKTYLLDIDVKAIVLALAHCYHSRFINKSVRETYRKRLLEGFKRNNFTCLSNERDIHDIIKMEQRDILNRMDLPPGTAKNTALEENVFVILVCILNKIPIFVVGKPGCSKSLAMQVIRSNLRGKDSRDVFFKTLPQLYCVSFQGSESSTSDGIIKVFEKAENYQKSNSKDSVLSVVILDEIGLAEISRFNPLKVLHNLLEPEGRSRPNVAVVGISNWALDASKMNRAVHLSRPEMDEEELFETAISISNSFIESIQVHEGLSWSEKKKSALSQDDIEDELRLVAKAYTNYTKKLQFRNFHGLRDFYSLVKFIARKLAEDFKNLTSQKKSAVIMEGLLRNFGGLKSGRQDLLNHFNDCFQNSAHVSLSSVELIGGNIGDIMARHLMIITKGESVLGILEQNLSESGRERKEIIFGSQFEEDLTDDYNYRILSRIILCMEQGIVLVLKDLENIYGSLYDMLNQNYTRIGKKNNCRVALGPYSNPFCHVADSFRCIVLVDESKVDYADPPFLNRFEKQFLSFADVMDDEESNLVYELENWIENITKIEGKPFSKYSSVPNYNEELIVSLIMLFKRKSAQSDYSLLDECKAELLWILRPEVIVRLSRVHNSSIQQSSEQMKKRYFQLPLHQGLRNLIEYQISAEHHEQMTVVFTNSNIHTQISEELNTWRCQSEKLGAFKSEKQLSVKLQQFWNNQDMQILLVHCNALEDDKHIMLTKSLIEKYRAEYLEKADEHCLKLVYLIVHLGCRDISQFNDVSSNSLLQMNYLSGWKLLLLENLERPKTSLPDFCSKSLLETIEDMLPMTDCLKEELFWAFTRLQYGVHGRDVESIKRVIDTINNSDSFLLVLSEMIWSYVQDVNNGQNDADWFVNVACDTQALNTSAFLIDALERQIRKMIKIPLAKIVYKLEHLGAIDSYFIDDENSAERKKIWCANIKNEKIFSYNIKDKPIKDATGPECYQCDTPDLGLKLPFSRVIFESIEETKDLFTDEVMRSKLKCELETDDSLPDEIMSEIILQQESFILKRLSNILESCDMIEILISDYITDFCNLYSYTLSSVLDRDTRNEYMRWTLEQKVNLSDTDIIQLFTRIHCAGWSHNALFGSVIQLLELCANVFVGENSNVLVQFKQVVHGNDSTVEVVSGDIQEQIQQLHTLNSSSTQLNDEFVEELQDQDSMAASYGNVSETKQAVDKTISSDIEILQSDAHVFKDDEEVDNVNKLTNQQGHEIIYIGQQGYNSDASKQDEFKQVVYGNDSTVEVVSSDIQDQIKQLHALNSSTPQLNDELVEESQLKDQINFTASYGNVSETKQVIDKTISSDIEILESDAHVFKGEEGVDNVNKLTDQQGNEIIYIGQQGYNSDASTQDKFKQANHGNDSTDKVVSSDIQDQIKQLHALNSSTPQLNDELGEELQVQDQINCTASYGNVSEMKQVIDKTISSDIEILESDAYVFEGEEEVGNVNKLTDYKSNEAVCTELEGYDSDASIQDAANIEDTDMENANTKIEDSDKTYLKECSIKVSQLNEKLYLPKTNGVFQEYNEEYGTGQNENEEMIEDLNIDNFTQASEYIQSENACNSSVLKIKPETETIQSHKETIFKLSGDSVQDIVSFVCTKMIPTTKNLTRFAGLKNWHVTVRNILIVAAEVSTDSVALHALRLCNDIVTELVMPYKLNLATLQNIGDSLVSGSVGSDEVFSGLLSIFQHVECANSSVHVQRTICQFLIRCLSTDSDTDITAYTYLFKAIEERSIPEDNLQLLKAPLSFLVKQELDNNEDIFKELLADSTEDGNPVTDSLFLSTLDSCLHSLFIQGRIESPFVLLIVDILQETFETDEDTDSSYELMLRSGKILQNNNIGLTSIAAVAYLKTAISYITDIISSNNKTDVSALLTELNAVLSGLCDNPVHRSILEYFLKGLGHNSALCTVMKQCSRMSADYPFLDNLVWTDGYLAKTLECNPLALDVPIEMLLEGEKYTTAQQTTESYKTSISKLMDLSASGLLLLYSLAMKDFFLPRYRGMLNDMEKSQAAVLLEQFQKHQHPAEHNTLMACILGKRDFLVNTFMLGEGSSFQQYMVNCILVSCFARCLSICKEKEGQPSAFLKRCLLKPLQLKDCFLPGFPDRIDAISFETENFVFQEGSIFAACECNRRLLFRTQDTPLICVVCRKEIPDENKQIIRPSNKSHHIQATPGFTYKSHMIDMHVTVRKLSDVSFNTLQLLAKGCLLGSVALGISKREQVEEFIAETSPEIDISDRLEKEIYHHWKMLKELLNMSDHDVGMFLHSLLHLGIHVLFKERNALVTAAHRDLWETKFENIISKLLDNRVHTIQHSIVSCNNIYKLPAGSIEVVIREANTTKTTEELHHHEQLPGLFRISIKPSKRDFLCQLWPHRETYPFLTMFVKQESKLALPQHIYQILQWHMTTVVNTSYSFKRQDCLKMTVREFHNSLTDLNKRKMSKKKFENFRSSWSIVKKALDDSEDFETLLSINYDTKMSDCLILDTDCDMYKAFSFLISTQNDFIDQALQLSFTCKNLQFLLRDIDIACFKVVPVTELKKENLIDVSFDWGESLSQESNSGLGYGLGKQVHYDFCNIEKELSVDLLVRKAFISLEALPKIIFTDELYRNFVTLLADVQHSIPQKSLPTDLEVAFVKTNKDKANMTLELINYLDMILTLLKKAKYDPQKSLTEFVKERINILGQKFPSQYLPSPESRVKICHIVALHELLEEMSVDRILGSLGDTYSTDLESDLEDHFSNMPVASIRKSEHVLKAIKRFIYRCIFMCDTDPEQPLIQFLSQESFWPTSIFRDGKLKLDGKEEDIKEIILPEVLVCHVVSAVLCLNESIETQKQGELRMDRVITSWKSKGENITKGKERKKAMKKLRKS